jgi:4'-phosphopantetheinyl transferase
VGAANLASSWPFPPPDLALLSDDVHVWRASLEQPVACIRQLARTLSDDERARTEGFHFERDRRRFTVGHGVLRTILGRYLGIEPRQLLFRYGPRGKPYLAEEPDNCALRFNLAHSHELALYAFTCGREVGVDLEHVHPMPDAEQIGARFFSAREYATLSALPKSQKLEAFFNCWTRKEAYLKATGTGLTRPLDQFDVSLVPGEPARLLYVEGEPQEVARWSLEALAPGADYVGAVAVQGRGWRLRCWQWTWSQGGDSLGSW